MVPWPIAVLSVFYAAVAASSAAHLWQAAQGASGHGAIWPAGWCVLSVSLVVGLALLQPWARAVAVGASVIMMLGALAAAWVAIAGGQPNAIHSLWSTGFAGVQLVIIRYLTRPHVKAWFVSPSALRKQ